jgi:hypothetical protein
VDYLEILDEDAHAPEPFGGTTGGPRAMADRV